jgi:hypothetical protein
MATTRLLDRTHIGGEAVQGDRPGHGEQAAEPTGELFLLDHGMHHSRRHGHE